MKRMTSIILSVMFLSACSGNPVEQDLKEANERNEELKRLLQTEEVSLQKNSQRLENLEQEISKMKEIRGNPDISKYVQDIESYASEMESSFDELDKMIRENEESPQNLQSNFKEVEKQISRTIEDYNDETTDVELDDYLKRRHESILLANDEILAAIDILNRGIENDDSDLFKEGLDQLKQVNEYY
ncbi:hypothetical protein ACFPFV_11095 [Salinicoccus siamensis]|uniref:Cell-wall binding lipoprotein n=1 Tax=Salinicoccus siamensis TaxID=381830 RepID=A0ABV5Z4L5_9STAP